MQVLEILKANSVDVFKHRGIGERTWVDESRMCHEVMLTV